MKQKLQRLQRLALQGRVTRIPERGKPKQFIKLLPSVYITPAEALAHGGGFVAVGRLEKSKPFKPTVTEFTRVEIMVTPRRD